MLITFTVFSTLHGCHPVSLEAFTAGCPTNWMLPLGAPADEKSQYSFRTEHRRVPWNEWLTFPFETMKKYILVFPPRTHSLRVWSQAAQHPKLLPLCLKAFRFPLVGVYLFQYFRQDLFLKIITLRHSKFFFFSFLGEKEDRCSTK